MNCALCQCNVENNKEVFTAVNDLIASGVIPQMSYNDLVTQLCNNAGCQIE